jgi:Flp pilus assembly protein TadD
MTRRTDEGRDVARLAAVSGARRLGRRGCAALAVLVLPLVLATGCSRFVILHDPLGPAEHNDLGVAYEREGRYELAAREYRRALRDEPGFTRARVNLGNLAARDGAWRQAEKSYRRALRHEPDDTDALNNLAVALARQGRRLDEAERLAERALAIGGPDSLYLSTLAEVRRARARP